MTTWLWLADVGPATQAQWVARHENRLSASEAIRLQRIVRPWRRAQFLAGHALLRRLLATCAEVAEERVVIESRGDGRPEVGSPTGWCVSIAHSRRFVAALAAAGPQAVGVDVEWMNPDRDIDAIVQALGEPPPGSREIAYQWWARHEAEVKVGAGASPVWVTNWNDFAVAVCAGEQPGVVATVDLASQEPARALALFWVACTDGWVEGGGHVP